MYRPEMRPMNLTPNLGRGDGRGLVMPEAWQKFFQELHDQGCQAIDERFPGNVIDQRSAGKAVDQRNSIGQEHDFTHQQGADGGGDEKTGEINVIILQEEFFSKGDDIKSNKEKEGGADNF